ncbi:thioredoxin domain-containing protein [Actinomycetaceae bacterium L2_0104]
MASRNTPGTSGSNLTKQQRREQAREAARKLQEEEAKRTRRNKLMAIIGSIVVVALVGTAIFFIVRSGKDQSSGEDWADFEPAASVFTEGTPENVNDQGGISVGSNLVAGTENEGAPTVTIYFDYLCSYCNQLEGTYADELTQMAEDGDITLIYQPVSILGQEFSDLGAAADYYLAANAPEQYLEFHNTVFSEVTEPLFEEGANLPAPTAEDLLEVANEVGVPDDVVTGLEATLADGSYQKWVDLAYEQFGANGLNGTPRVIIDGRELVNWPDGNLTKYAREAVEGA